MSSTAATTRCRNAFLTFDTNRSFRRNYLAYELDGGTAWPSKREMKQSDLISQHWKSSLKVDASFAVFQLSDAGRKRFRREFDRLWSIVREINWVGLRGAGYDNEPTWSAEWPRSP